MFMESDRYQRALKIHQPCSDCHSHDALAIYSDHTYCYACGTRHWTGKERALTAEEEACERIEKMTETVELGKIREIADRCLTAETCNKFQVRSLVKEHRIQKHYYPYFSKTGEKVAEKVRIVDTKEFYWWGNQRDVALFGAQCQPTTGRFVVVCEGEIDAMTMWQVLGGRSTVVSVPGGCKSFKALKDNYEYLDKFDSIVLCFDGDKAGREAVEKAVMFLPQKKLKIMRLPEELKDPNEFLKAGKVQELTNYFWRAEQYSPKDIVNIGDMYGRLEEYRKTHEYIPTPWCGVNEYIAGTRPGQLIVLAAGTGMGKSAFLKSWMYHLVKSTDLHLGALYLEENPEETVLSLMSLSAGKNLKKNSVWDACSEEDKKRFFDDCGASRRIDLFEPLGNTDADYVCNKIRYMAVVRDCKIIWLDHITYTVDSEENPRLALNKLMKNLHDLCVELSIVIIAACHLRKSSDSRKTAEEGSRITLDDMKDSSSIKQLADVCIGLERDSQNNDPVKANTTLIRILKNRDYGCKGLCTAVFYDKDTTRLQEVGLEEMQDEALELKDE